MDRIPAPLVLKIALLREYPITSGIQYSGWLEVLVVERERTPRRLMKLDIWSHLAGLSLSNIVSKVEKFGVHRSRKPVLDWVQKADLQPVSDEAPSQVALDETVIRVNDEQCWLYVAVDPKTNHVLHIRLYLWRITALTEKFLAEGNQKQDVEHAEFLVDGVPWLQTALDRHGLRFRHVTYGNRNSVERVYKEVKRRTSPFSKCIQPHRSHGR